VVQGFNVGLNYELDGMFYRDNEHEQRYEKVVKKHPKLSKNLIR
jgi:hypothetical protein